MVLSLMSILIIIIFLSFGIMVKSPKYGLYLYKGAILIIMVIVLFVALFFSLGPNDISSLNINLHPWKNYLRYRVIAAVVCDIVIFAISQFPLLFVKYHKKMRLMKYEGSVYIVALIIGIICLTKFSGVDRLNDAKLQAGNDVVRLIDEYNRTHQKQCQSLSELGLKPAIDYFYEYKGMWFVLNANDKAFDLRFCSPHGSNLNYDFTYSSDIHEWHGTIIW